MTTRRSTHNGYRGIWSYLSRRDWKIERICMCSCYAFREYRWIGHNQMFFMKWQRLTPACKQWQNPNEKSGAHGRPAREWSRQSRVLMPIWAQLEGHTQWFGPWEPDWTSQRCELTSRCGYESETRLKMVNGAGFWSYPSRLQIHLFCMALRLPVVRHPCHIWWHHHRWCDRYRSRW